MKQEESRQAQMNNYRAFGRRPGNRRSHRMERKR